MPLDYTRLFPPIGAPKNQLLNYRDRVINPYSIIRNQNMARITLATWYAIGKQWAEVDPGAAFDGMRGSIFREQETDFPRPVSNEIDPALEQEVINLVKRRWQPKVTADHQDPAIKAAAQVANDQVNYRLEQLDWNPKRHQLGIVFAMMGTSHIYTASDPTYMDLTIVGSRTAMSCVSCEMKLYSDQVPQSLLQRGLGDGTEGGAFSPARFDNATPVPMEPDFRPDLGDEQLLQIHSCPQCGSDLNKYEPNPDEAETGQDPFGRPLGVAEPRFISTLEIDIPHEIYPENGGYKVTPYSQRRVGRRKVRSMEWIAERYPHLVGSMSPDGVNDLVYGDPLLGEWDIFGSWGGAYDRGVLDNHKNIDEVIELPSLLAPKGRYMVCTKDEVLEEGELLKSRVCKNPDGSPGEEIWVPRAMLSGARFKIRTPNDYWGQTISDQQISRQNRLNGIDSQMVETRERLGEPNILMTPGMWVPGGPQMDPLGGGNKYFFWQPDPSAPDQKPVPIQGTLMGEGVMIERQQVLDGMRRALLPTSADMPVKNVGTTSGLQLQIEQDEKSRSLREDSLVYSAEASFTHLLQLEWVLRVDPDIYRVTGPDKTNSWLQYDGNALRGQTECKIERGSFISKSVVQREAMREAIADQILIIDSPFARAKALEAYGLDEEFNTDTNRQVDHAERVWVDFRDKRKVRVLDEIDNYFIHYQVLGTHLRTEEGERLADDVQWDGVMAIIAGWEMDLMQMQEIERQSVAFYGGRPTGPAAAEAYAQAMVDYDKNMMLYQQQQQIQQQLSAEASAVPGAAPTVQAMAPQPPQVPPQPAQFPPLMQERILMIWQSKLMEQQWQPQPPPPESEQVYTELLTDRQPMDVETFLKFRALVSAYKWMQSPIAQTMPAPGSGGTMLPGDTGAPVGPDAAAAGQGNGAVPSGGTPAPVPPTAPSPTGGAN